MPVHLIILNHFLIYRKDFCAVLWIQWPSWKSSIFLTIFFTSLKKEKKLNKSLKNPAPLPIANKGGDGGGRKP